MDYKVQYAVTPDFLPSFMLLRANKTVLIVSGASFLSFLAFPTSDLCMSCSTKRNNKSSLGNIYWIRRCWDNFHAVPVSFQVESIYQSLAKTPQNNHLAIVPALHFGDSDFQTGKKS